MATFERCDESVETLRDQLLVEFYTHKPLLDARVKIDLVFAFAETDDHGAPRGFAFKRGGVRCLGICRIIKLKDRAMGRGDAEISLDGDWWDAAPEKQRRALLDHELHHLDTKKFPNGKAMTDDRQRPLLMMRRHDFDFGWFKVIAERHGAASMERIQAKQILDESGQLLFPMFRNPVAV